MRGGFIQYWTVWLAVDVICSESRIPLAPKRFLLLSLRRFALHCSQTLFLVTLMHHCFAHFLPFCWISVDGLFPIQCGCYKFPEGTFEAMIRAADSRDTEPIACSALPILGVIIAGCPAQSICS